MTATRFQLLAALLYLCSSCGAPADPCMSSSCTEETDGGLPCSTQPCLVEEVELAQLSITPGQLSFSPAITRYTVTVPAGTQSVEVRATVASAAHATLSINGVGATSGASVSVALLEAVTNVVVQVATPHAARSYLIAVSKSTSAVTALAYLKASNPGPSDYFGNVVMSADGATLAVGAIGQSSQYGGINPTMEDKNADSSGAVYVFARTATGWAQQAYIKASNPEAGDWFGVSLALSGDGNTLVVGAPGEDGNSTGVNGPQEELPFRHGSGAAYVFVRNGTSWTQQAYLKASNADAGDQFGAPVAISADGKVVVVGAPQEDSKSTGVNGDQADDSASDSGAVYVFVRTGSDWAQQAYLKASNTEKGDQFGTSLAISWDGKSLAVGAPLEDSGANGVNSNQASNNRRDSGAVYVFVNSGGWAQQAYLKASNTDSEDYFGSSLSLSGDGTTLAVGAPQEDSGTQANQDSNSAPDSGAMYVFARAGITWAQQAYLKASDAARGDGFSHCALSGDGNVLVVGAGGADGKPIVTPSGAALNTGAAYVFVRSGTLWSQRQNLSAPNADPGDRFGGAVAISGDGATVAVGAHREDSYASGVNGDSNDNSEVDTGAVYVFQ